MLFITCNETKDSIQIFITIKVNNQPPAAVGVAIQVDACAQRCAETIFQIADLVIKRVGGWWFSGGRFSRGSRCFL